MDRKLPSLARRPPATTARLGAPPPPVSGVDGAPQLAGQQARHAGQPLTAPGMRPACARL